MVGSGCNVTRLTRSTPGGVRITRGGRGAGVQWGGTAAEDVWPFWARVGNRWWSSQAGRKPACSNLVPAWQLVGSDTRRMLKPTVTLFGLRGRWSTARWLDEKSAIRLTKIRLKPLFDQLKIGHRRKAVQNSSGRRHHAFWDAQADLLCENKMKSVKISQNFNFVRFKTA